ncbi:YheC/YheD family protein [Bacillus sp. JJ1503]|uniref:YheC/YheD family protein n=1 Tax=Bacillus sp. JJ1503 TaxID=3122956 RepID=UPI002FFE7442
MRKKSKMNKWDKHQLLLECKNLVEFLPETHLFTIGKFWEMMSRNKEIILKPALGNGGKRIIKVSKVGGEKYEVHLQKSKNVIVDKNGLERLLQERIKERKFLIQYCIPLAKVNGNLIDFRYIVQRKHGDKTWVITARCGKVAKNGYVTTNVLNDGTVVTVEEALLNSNINNLNLKKTLAALDELALAASLCYTDKFKNQNIWGYDLAVDECGDIWLIEANAAPMVDVFLDSKNPFKSDAITWYLDYNEKMRNK